MVLAPGRGVLFLGEQDESRVPGAHGVGGASIPAGGASRKALMMSEAWNDATLKAKYILGPPAGFEMGLDTKVLIPVVATCIFLAP